MNIGFAIVSDALPTRCRMIKNIEELSKAVPVNVDTELILDLSNIIDTEESIWIYSPITEMYYELFNKNKNEKLIDVYPSMYAEVTSDCKAGLAMYSEPSTTSKFIERRDIGELYEITPAFVIDSNNNIWVYVVNVDENIVNDKDVDIHDYVSVGWTLYKNFRNKFANLYIHGKYNSLLNGGMIDELKVLDFTSWLWEIKFKKWFKLIEPLQLFATSTKKNANTGSSNSVELTTGSFYSTYTPKETRTETTATFNAIHKPGTKYINPKTGVIKYRGNTKKWNSRYIVQNKRNYPTYESSSPSKFDYEIKDEDIVSSEINKIRSRMLFDNDNYDTVINRVTHYYNRFKVATPGDILSRGIPHVFFTRPDCNLFSDSKATSLVTKVKADSNFNYAFYHKPNILRQLSQNTKLTDDWMWLLSNKVLSFQPTDESINVDKYGTNYYKNSIAYGRTNYESKAAGEFSCTIQDTKELDLFHLHKLWTDYISNVYCGKWVPKHKYIWQKILDYACSAYYVVTAEDGETIIFWSKYYGVFPTNVPSSSYGWSENSFIEQQKLSISYQYSFKEDYNPQSLIELNLNSRIESDVTYEPIYDETIGTSGRTWVSSPFVETVKPGAGSGGNNDYYFKLRFKKK